MQTAIEPKRAPLGILPVDVKLLEEMFHLPEGYLIVGVAYDPHQRIVNFTLLSEHLPDGDIHASLPQLMIHVTSETFPDTPPEYRKITTEVQVR